MTERFVSITEDGLTLANAEQATMAATRYEWVRANTSPNDLLVDVAAGTAYGLRRVDRQRVVAADLVYENLSRARKQGHAGPLMQADAQRLPLRRESVDVICCLEALYYLSSPAAFFEEAADALRPGGRLLVSLPNRRRPAFQPSSASVTYPDAAGLRYLALRVALVPELWGGFSWQSPRPIWENAMRTAAVRLHLVPRSMRAKSLLKRLMYRRMQPLAETVGVTPAAPLHPVMDAEGAPWTMLYLIATKPLR